VCTTREEPSIQVAVEDYADAAKAADEGLKLARELRGWFGAGQGSPVRLGNPFSIRT